MPQTLLLNSILTYQVLEVNSIRLFMNISKTISTGLKLMLLIYIFHASGMRILLEMIKVDFSPKITSQLIVTSKKVKFITLTIKLTGILKAQRRHVL